MVIVDIYGRVSTQEQAQEGYSIGEQEDRLKKYCEAQGWIINKVLMDGGYSGASMHRPALQQAITDAKSKQISKLVVYKLDRLSRSQKDTLYIIEDVLIKNNVDFVSMTESLDTSTPFGMAMIGILSVFAQLERETIRERMTIGRDARVKSGKFRGSGNIPIGFRYVDGQLVLDEYEAMMVKSAYEAYSSGATASSIASDWLIKRFRSDSWSAEKITHLLTQPLYIGRQRYKGEEYMVEGCPHIVSDDLWKAVQREIDRRTNRHKEKPQTPYKHTTMLGGLIWCGCCGQRYLAESDKLADGTKIHRYYCRGRVLKNHHHNVPQCSNRSWRADELNNLILGEVRKLKADRGLLESIVTNPVEDYLSQQRAIQSKIDELDEQISRLVKLYSLGSIPFDSIMAQADELEEKKDALQHQLETLEHPAETMTADDADDLLQTFADLVDIASPEGLELHDIVHQLIESITLDGDNITIKWAFAAR